MLPGCEWITIENEGPSSVKVGGMLIGEIPAGRPFTSNLEFDVGASNNVSLSAERGFAYVRISLHCRC